MMLCTAVAAAHKLQAYGYNGVIKGEPNTAAALACIKKVIFFLMFNLCVCCWDYPRMAVIKITQMGKKNITNLGLL